jgi:hypothetical protein
LIPEAKPEREDSGGGYSYWVDGEAHKVNHWPDREDIYTYTVDGNTLILRASDKDTEMVLTRRDSTPAFAAADEKLLGTWKHVDEKFSPSETITLTFSSDGKVLMESLLGDRRRSETAGWHSDGKRLRLSGVKFLGQDDAEFVFEYRIDGELLVLRQIGEADGNEEIVFTKSKEGERES